MSNLYKRMVTLAMVSVTALLAWVYCIIEYRDKTVYIVGISLVVIASIYALLSAYADLRITKDAKMKNYVNETLLNALANISSEDYSDELAEFEKLTKATYVQIRKINTNLSEIIEDDTKSLQLDVDGYEALSASIDKIAKVVVKYGQANNEQLISVINDLSDNLERINSNIELVRSEMINMDKSVPIRITRERDDNNQVHFTAEKEPETEADVIPFPAKEEDVDPNRPMTPEEIEALFAAAGAGVEEPNGSDIVQPEEDNTIDNTEVDNSQQATDSVTPEPIDDPNRPMTPEEIAALFASMQ